MVKVNDLETGICQARVICSKTMPDKYNGGRKRGLYCSTIKTLYLC